MAAQQQNKQTEKRKNVVWCPSAQQLSSVSALWGDLSLRCAHYAAHNAQNKRAELEVKATVFLVCLVLPCTNSAGNM